MASSSSSKAMKIIGWILGVLPCGLLAFSAIGKFSRGPQVVEGFNHLGWPIDKAVLLAVLEIGSTVLYLIPQTAGVGAILLTGYMGGAIATHLRIGEPVLVQCLIPVLLWLGLFLRDSRVRQLIPVRS